jgi:hypothetical protein
MGAANLNFEVRLRGEIIILKIKKINHGKQREKLILTIFNKGIPYSCKDPIVYIGTTVGALGSDCFVLRKVDGDDDGANNIGAKSFVVTGLPLSETLISSDKKSNLSNGMGWQFLVASAIQTEDISKACDE